EIKGKLSKEISDDMRDIMGKSAKTTATVVSRKTMQISKMLNKAVDGGFGKLKAGASTFEKMIEKTITSQKGVMDAMMMKNEKSAKAFKSTMRTLEDASKMFDSTAQELKFASTEMEMEFRNMAEKQQEEILSAMKTVSGDIGKTIFSADL